MKLSLREKRIFTALADKLAERAGYWRNISADPTGTATSTMVAVSEVRQAVLAIIREEIITEDMPL